ncbi:hypothetical protein ERJ75_000731400 [Trypanosoma vivax]|nr:hypothetical protein ERJ75_000731400 [Trypanosoma vivax]
MPLSLVSKCQRRIPLSSIALFVPFRTWCTSLTLRSKSKNTEAEQEDREELERELQLRNRFAEKIRQSMPQCAGREAGSCGGSDGDASNQRASSIAHQAARFIFFVSTFMLLMGAMSMMDPNLPVTVLRNIQWWQLPAPSVACYVLMRALLPFREHCDYKRSTGVRRASTQP